MNCNETLSIERQKRKAIVMFKTLNGQSPQYLGEMFSSRFWYYSIRNINRKLFIPKLNTDYLKRSFYSADYDDWIQTKVESY